MKSVPISRAGKPDQAALVDEYGELQRRLALAKPDHDRADALRNEIAGWFEKRAPDQEFQVEGARYVVQISARPIKRRIRDITKVFAAIGKTSFLAACTLPLSAIERLIDPLEHARFLDAARTGERSIKAIPKAAAKAA